MAISNLPPWLNIGPTDYLQAIQAGTQAGLEVSRQRAAMQEAAARRIAAQQESQRAAWEFGENLRQQAQLAALERERKQQTELTALDWDREQRRMQSEQDAKKAMLENAKSQETARHNLAMEGISKAKDEASVMPTPWERDPNKEYITRGGAHIPLRKDSLSELPVSEKLEATSEIPAVPAQAAEKRSLFGIDWPLMDWLWPDKPAIPGTPYQPARGERTIKRALLPEEAAMLGIPENALPQMGTNAPPANVSALKDQAQAAITAGAPEDAVRKRFRELTGQELD